MNKLENYLNSLDKKNLIMLYLSVFVIFFIVYYNYNYTVLQKRIDTNENQLYQLQQKLNKLGNYNQKLIALKKELKKVKQENLSFREDLKYLNVLVKTSSILYIKDKQFIDILKSILQNATDNNIKATYQIDKKKDNYKRYIININGEFDTNGFYNFYNFVKSLESIKAVKEIENINFTYDEKAKLIKFNLKFSIWGLL